MENTQRQRYEKIVNSLIGIIPHFLSCCAKNSLINKIKAQVCDHIMYETTNDDEFIDAFQKIVMADIHTIKYGKVYEHDDAKYKEHLTNVLHILLDKQNDKVENISTKQYDVIHSNECELNELCRNFVSDEVIDSYMNEFDNINDVSNYVSEYIFLQKAIKFVPERAMNVKMRFKKIAQLSADLNEKITCDDVYGIEICEDIIHNNVKEYTMSQQEITDETDEQFIAKTTKKLREFEEQYCKDENQYKDYLINELYKILHNKIFAFEADKQLWDDAIDKQVTNYIKNRKSSLELEPDFLIRVVSAITNEVNNIKYWMESAKLCNELFAKLHSNKVLPNFNDCNYDLWNCLVIDKVNEYLRMYKNNGTYPTEETYQRFIEGAAYEITTKWKKDELCKNIAKKIN